MKLLQFINNLRKNRGTKNVILYSLVISAVTLSFVTYYAITNNSASAAPDPSVVMGWLLIDLTLILSTAILLSRRFFKIWFRRKQDLTGSKLQNRIVLMFCLIAAIPTLVISIFSAYFFNFGIQSWFDQKINNVLNKSVQVAESYIAEHRIEMKNTAWSITDDFSNLYHQDYQLLNNPELFNKFLDGEVETRGLTEAIIFQPNGNRVLARTSLSFVLTFANIPKPLFNQADSGEVVEITSDPTKIRMLVKLPEYNAYLLIGKLIDKSIIEHVDKTHGAVEEYMRLKKRITNMQIKFSIIFIVMTIILLVATIISGVIFAARIISPIKKLLSATHKVKQGDLSIRVQEGVNDDEITMLSSAFNSMLKQINHQQKELIVAQRALAWSDVAQRVAHEIKNPLTPIQLCAERLNKKFADEVKEKNEFIKYTSTILQHTQNIGKIISDFVNFAKIPTPRFEHTDIVKTVSDIVESYTILNEKITYNFTTNISQCDFICDTTQINQIMINLLKNAEEALEHSPIKIVNVSIFKEDNLLSLIVSDSGKGIEENLLERITEPYMTTKTKGTGLGLAIVKKIVQDHAGSIEITNNPGATIKLTFNLDKLAEKIN